jgi:hypothetical protein
MEEPLYQKMPKWTAAEFAMAMENAIVSNANNRLLKIAGTKIMFNGFWRDGDKQNVCAWLDSATWHDAKTGEGGGCKDFAKVAFNMELKDFMNLYSSTQMSIPISIKEAFDGPPKPNNLHLDALWKSLIDRDEHRIDHANEWLEKKRGFKNPRSNIGSGFANLYEADFDLFNFSHYGFLKHRLSLGSQLIAPIRGASSDRVLNLFFRSINNDSKENKSRLLQNCGGWGANDGERRAFGFPHLMREFPRIVLCEGMADYFAVECLLGPTSNYLAIGVPSASALPKWAQLLSETKFLGHITLLYQLDTNLHGKISSQAVGQARASEALRILLHHKQRASLFDWGSFLMEIKPQQIPKDIADMFLISEDYELLSSAFLKILQGTN